MNGLTLASILGAAVALLGVFAIRIGWRFFIPLGLALLIGPWGFQLSGRHDGVSTAITVVSMSLSVIALGVLVADVKRMRSLHGPSTLIGELFRRKVR